MALAGRWSAACRPASSTLYKRVRRTLGLSPQALHSTASYESPRKSQGDFESLTRNMAWTFVTSYDCYKLAG